MWYVGRDVGFVYQERRERFETSEAAWQKLLMPIFSTVTDAADMHGWTGWGSH